MTDDGRFDKALLEFFGALATTILAIDNPMRKKASSAEFLWLLDQLLRESPSHEAAPMQFLRQHLEDALNKGRAWCDASQGGR